VIGFEVETADAANAVCDSLRVIRSATSLGGVESTIERRGKLPGQEHLPPGFLRLSVGCEHVEDLWDDLASALGQIGS
jgi:cystathionine gamma-synthase